MLVIFDCHLDVTTKGSHCHTRIIFSQKPENIGFNADGELKLFDFGLAKQLNNAEKLSDGSYRLTGAFAAAVLNATLLC